MDIFFTILKKGLVATVLLVFTFVIVYTPQQFNQINKVGAMPVVEVGPSGVANIATAASTAIVATATTAETARTFTLNGIAWAIAKAIVSSMVSSLVSWINSGFQGKPAFIEDLDGFLLDAADQAVGQYIEELGGIGSFLCSPFKLDIQIALSLQYQSARERKPYEGCTLSGMVSNIEDFVEGSFSDGGWEDWFAITSEPEVYTPYGQLIEAQASVKATLINAKDQELTKVNWGTGFLSGKICKMIQGPVGPKEKCTISMPGATIAKAIDKRLGAGQDALITADEINEILAALIGQIANKAITGAAGFLGLSAGTGQTYDGYNGGSYLSAMDQEAQQLVDDAIGAGADTFTEPLDVQREYNALARTYLPQLSAVASDASSSNQAAAATAYNNAVTIISITNQNTVALTALRDEYRDLLLEGQSPSVAPARKTAIQNRQIEIITEFTTLGAYTREQMNSSQSLWSSIVS